MLPIVGSVRPGISLLRKIEVVALPHPVDWTACQQFDRCTCHLRSTIARVSTHPLLYQPLPSGFVTSAYGTAIALSHVVCGLGKPREKSQIMETFRASRLDNDSDLALVTATRCGDTGAFERLVLRYKPRIFAVAKRITKNREDAEDVVQESFHKAFRHLNSFQEKSRFSTWVTRIAMNEAFMLLRRRRGIPEIMPQGLRDDDAESFSAKFVDLQPSPEESCCLRERKEILTAAINRLGPKIRRTILLRDIEERSIEETAQILGASVGVVKSRLFQGRRKLRATVSPSLMWEVYTSGSVQAQLG
jgi:RNA polymerase sigma-70 factor (ECF subfamily)